MKKPSSLTAATSPGLYGSLDGKVVAHGDAGNAIAVGMGTGEAHGDALARLARCSVAPCADGVSLGLPAALTVTPVPKSSYGAMRDCRRCPHYAPKQMRWMAPAHGI